MVKIAPPEPRSEIVERPDGLQVVIPVKQHWLALVFLSICSLFCAGGAITILTDILQGNGQGPLDPFSRVMGIGLWVILGGAFTGYAWGWMLSMKEQIVLSKESLVARRTVLGFGRSREFQLDHIRLLRFSRVVYDPWNASLAQVPWGMNTGVIAFDYGARTYRFGLGLDEAEAKLIVALIAQRFPSLNGRHES